MKLRFKVQDTDSVQFTDWIEESIRHRQAGIPTATSEMERLREQYPRAVISIERDYVVVPPKPKLFRYEIFVPEGLIQIIDKDGSRSVKLTNHTLQSRPFQESEQESVQAEVIGVWPNAQLTLREVK